MVKKQTYNTGGAAMINANSQAAIKQGSHSLFRQK